MNNTKKEGISDKKLRNAIFGMLDVFQELNISRERIVDIILSGSKEEEKRIPVSIFDNSKISSFEAIVKYLRENIKLKNKEIAAIVNRSQSAVASTFLKARRKMPGPLSDRRSEYDIPVTLIKNRENSVLEHIVKFLHDKHRLSFSQIGRMLNRNQRTIWTTYNRKRYDAKKQN